MRIISEDKSDQANPHKPGLQNRRISYMNK